MQKLSKDLICVKMICAGHWYQVYIRMKQSDKLQMWELKLAYSHPMNATTWNSGTRQWYLTFSNIILSIVELTWDCSERLQSYCVNNKQWYEVWLTTVLLVWPTYSASILMTKTHRVLPIVYTVLTNHLLSDWFFSLTFSQRI